MTFPTQDLVILGATGSIGQSTLDVVSRHPERFKVYALTAHTQWQKLGEMCVRFSPHYAVVEDEEKAAALRALLKQTCSPTHVLSGAQALADMAAHPEVDTVVAAIVGGAGLAPALAAAAQGKKILLANKEALVMAGRIFMHAVNESGAVLLPVDSEHNAIFQCGPLQTIDGRPHSFIRRILLTASGGPFRKTPVEDLTEVTPEKACAHPKWNMGRKISVDSATMMNKGLEVIEAHWLFGMPAERIQVVIHPESIVHSMVDYFDGSVLAQMGNPDMRIPIAYALGCPDRIESGVAPLDIFEIGSLTFEKPDFGRFPCLSLAYEALRTGGTAPAILNAANEEAVKAFLARGISFNNIHRVVASALEQSDIEEAVSLEVVQEADRRARALAQSDINSLRIS